MEPLQNPAQLPIGEICRFLSLNPSLEQNETSQSSCNLIDIKVAIEKRLARVYGVETELLAAYDE